MSDATGGGPGSSEARLPARWSQERRLAFIDFRLRWDGQLNRADLTGFFGISVPQASLDIARYVELAPANLQYDRSARIYLATPRFRALFETSAPARFLGDLLAAAAGSDAHSPTRLTYLPPVAVASGPTRQVNVDVLVALHQAIRQRSALRVTYQSLTRPRPAERVLSPHAFGHDGHRWHVRAYCHERADFRDFVIARMFCAHVDPADGSGQEHDASWNTSVRLVLIPHLGLSQAHRRAVELDYGMERGQLNLTCRQSMLLYVLRHLRLDHAAASGPGQQISLKNQREVGRHMAALGL